MATKKAASASKSTESATKKPRDETKKAKAIRGTTQSPVPTPKPEDAVKSSEFQQAKNKAEEYARDPEKVKKLVEDAKKLVEDTLKKTKGKNKGPLGEVWTYLTALIRLIRAYYNKRYTDVPWQTIVLAIAALIYFVSPIDLIPDFIPVAGYLDDAAVISFVVASIKADLDNFLDWEDNQKMQEDQSEE